MTLGGSGFTLGPSIWALSRLLCLPWIELPVLLRLCLMTTTPWSKVCLRMWTDVTGIRDIIVDRFAREAVFGGLDKAAACNAASRLDLTNGL